MELSQGAHKACKFAPEDFDIISRMPDNIITNILDRLPIQYAMRTSALSRAWRFKWTMLSQLVFDKNFFKYLSKRKRLSSFARIISMFILYHKGNITKFVLFRDANSVIIEDVDHWILFLHNSGIKDLTLDNKKSLAPLNLTPRLFSCSGLKHLKLVSCFFNTPASFHGFPNLLSLELLSVHFESGCNFGELFTLCPKLEILKFVCVDTLKFTASRKVYPRGKVKLEEIAKLVNLKILSLSLCNLGTKTIKRNTFGALGILPKLNKLHLDFHVCKFTKAGAMKCLPTFIPHLKTLILSAINLEDASTLSCAIETIRSFTNLQTLEITTCYLGDVPNPANVDYDMMEMLQLKSVVFRYSKGSENELCLIKYLLACSPFLKKIVICSSVDRNSNGSGKLRFSTKLLNNYYDSRKLKFSTKLLKLHRASSEVDIDFS